MSFRSLLVLAISLLALSSAPTIAEETADTGEWIPLFDGRTLRGWKANENPDSCQVEDGMLVIGGGPRSHLYYTGMYEQHDFKNFQLKLKVMTKPHANSGVYIHTQYQEEGWPESGYEIQVNNTHEDWRKTGSIYGIQDVKESPAKDDEWFDYLITVDGKKITVEVDGKTMNEFTETDDMPHMKEAPERKLSRGTIALQAHDPGSTVYYKDIQIKLLP